jgi:hypothetical protein
MKKGVLAGVITSVLITNPFSFHTEQSSFQQAAIAGKVSPPEASETALIVHDRDTIRTSVTQGNFFRQVKPGTYKLIVSAKAPFKNAAIGNLEVKRNHVLDVGELMLQR